MTPALKATRPLISSLVQLSRDGVPCGHSWSKASTNLYRSSSLITGGTPLRRGESSTRKSLVVTYASERSARRSAVVLTGAKRARGMQTAMAPSKQEMAEPMAVSSWKTLVEVLSRGSTVFAFAMSGSGRRPSCLTNCALRATRSIQRLLVLKYWYLDTSWKASSSSLGHWADSRRRRSPVRASRARWPPFLSASVRCATSIMKGASWLAK
mmetsp:Transcript_10165/g.34550  ORF Transcript_10165/g.34550 Transcript_10165/m.34550 type:complete len:211 (+) Transcript_10165:490-1122(+)